MNQPSTEGVNRGAARLSGFDEPEMEYQLLRGLGVCSYGGGTLGEIMVARENIDARMRGPEPAAADPARAWTASFSGLAQQVEEYGRSALAQGHRVSAREHLLRASMYYRAAEYFCDPYKPDHRRWGIASREAFILGASLLDILVQVVQIPYEGLWIPAYYLTPEGNAQGRRKTLLVNTGFDGSSEELYFQVGRAALDRHYNVLLIDGPGQTGMTRLHPQLKFRPDWEVPIKAVMDWLCARPDVDTDRIAAYGISLGGYFATRAACHEPRIKALAVNSPIVDLKAYQLGFFPAGMADDPPELLLEWFDGIPSTELPDSLRALLKIAFFRFGTNSLRDWVRMLDAFQCRDDLARLRAPCLSMVGAAEGAEPMKQAEYFKAHVAGPVDEHVFSHAEGADAHCQTTNLPLSAAVLFDWLDDRFK
ncbi:MAG: alpha/beta fold hydrolase [Alcaligenaceae bacterium]|nr:alpha/beta fold hydrolase [Alcaligenaceae bacterium]